LSGHRRGFLPARDRIVSQAMMGGRTFILLKAGPNGPESSKQTEIRLAYLQRILSSSHFGTGVPWPGRQAIAWGSAAIPRDMDNSPDLTVLLSGSQFRHVNERNVLQRLTHQS
jgi:hypothetical protein